MVLARVIHRFRLDYPRGEMMKQMYPTLLFLDRPVRVEIVERKYKYTRLPGAVPQPLSLLLIVVGCIIFFELKTTSMSLKCKTTSIFL